MKKLGWRAAPALMLVIVLSLSSVGFAFDDVTADQEGDKIVSLKERGLLVGDGKSFQGDKKLTYAEGVHLLVKAFDLNLDQINFIKEPLASDSFDHVQNDAWYAQDFIVANLNGITLPREVNPKDEMTREQFLHHLFTVMMQKGNFPFTKRLFILSDEADVNPDYYHSIQIMMNGRIVQVDEEGYFYPKRSITRREAAVMLHDTLEFVGFHTKRASDGGTAAQGVTMTEAPVNDEVKQVTISRGEMPHAGYGISIAKIVFVDETHAELYYQLHEPDPEKMYAQVITTPTASTYVASSYQITFKPVE